jgi:hypothetical protein
VDPVLVPRADLNTIAPGSVVVAMENNRGEFLPVGKFVAIDRGLMCVYPSYPLYLGYVYPWDELAARSWFDTYLFYDLGDVRPESDKWVAPPE